MCMKKFDAEMVSPEDVLVPWFYSAVQIRIHIRIKVVLVALAGANCQNTINPFAV